MTDYVVAFKTKNPGFINMSFGVATKSVLDFDLDNTRGQMLQRSNELKMTIIDLSNQNGPFNGLLSECFKRSNGIGELEQKKQMESAGKDKVAELVASL